MTREGRAPRRWCLQLSDGEEVFDWVVDATGRRGAVSRLLGVKRRRIDHQVALVGRLESERADDVDETLTVESTSSGWWYCCRVPGQRRVAAFVSASKPDTLTWESRLRASRHIGPLVETYRLEGTLLSRAADSTILEQCYGPQWVAIGDAAVSYDPLGSRGLISALKGGLEAASLVGAPESHLAGWQTRLREGFTAYRAERDRLIAQSVPQARF